MKNCISFPEMFKLYERAEKVLGGEAKDRVKALLLAWNEDGDEITWDHAEKAIHAAYSGKPIKLETYAEFAIAADKTSILLDPVRCKTPAYF